MIRTFFALLGATLVAATSHAQYVNGEAARSVLGQPNFTSTFGANPPTAASQNRPSGVAVDPVSGTVFVSDRNNSRILRYESTTAVQSGAAAIGVLGQPNFTSLTVATSQSGLRNPGGIWFDVNTGRLWVADTDNNRVVWFNNALTKQNGANADGVLGQSNFQNQGAAATATGMNKPSAVLISQDGALWVADTGNNRVLKFSTFTNGAAAALVLGQATANTSSTGAGSTGMNQPAGLASDVDMTLWVADSFNNRILGFANANSIVTNGAAATRVLGQPDLNTITEGTTATKLFRPEGLLVDLLRDTLYVADRANNRVLGFVSVTDKANGAAANRVIGATTFTDGFGGSTAAKFSNPLAIAIGLGDQLYIADRLNNRTLRFPPVSIPVLTGPGSARVKSKRKTTLVYRLTNTNYPGSYRLTFPGSNKNFKVSATLNGAPITSGGTTTTMGEGGVATLAITFKGKKAAKKPITTNIAATSWLEPFRSSTVTTKVKVK